MNALLALALAQSTTVDKIVAHARLQTTWGTTYDPAYVKLKYPGGDLPKEKGVCTDVVVRALRVVGYDLQKLIYVDKKANPGLYPAIGGSSKLDPNIDHRRVKNQVVYFKRFGQTLTLDTRKVSEWKPGDIVAWKLPGGLDHIGILTDQRNGSRLPFAVHNIGGTREEDVLTSWTLVGHYRFPKR